MLPKRLTAALTLLCWALATTGVVGAPAYSAGGGGEASFIPPKRPDQPDHLYDRWVSHLREGRTVLHRWMKPPEVGETADQYWQRMDDEEQKQVELAMLAFEQCMRDEVARLPAARGDNAQRIWIIKQECSAKIEPEYDVVPAPEAQVIAEQIIAEDQQRRQDRLQERGGGDGGGTSQFQALSRASPADVLKPARAAAVGALQPFVGVRLGPGAASRRVPALAWFSRGFGGR